MSAMGMDTQIWSPCEKITSECKTRNNYAMLILNTPINFLKNPQFIVNLWNGAQIRITVDGGTKHWLNWLSTTKTNIKDVLPPDLVTGDMDSINEEVLDYFRKESKIVYTPDQNETDYTKALNQLKEHTAKENIEFDTVYVLADTCGRLDHIMGNINTLFKAQVFLSNVKIFHIATRSISWYLNKGNHCIKIPSNLREAKEWCALLPIGGPCVVTSTGLKWNLINNKLEFGELVSTSNTYDGSPEVTIQTDSPLIWSMGITNLLL